MKCTNCGEELVAGAKFCPNCGTKVVLKKFCINCGIELQPTAKFCPECGAKQDVVAQAVDVKSAEEIAKTSESEKATSSMESGVLHSRNTSAEAQNLPLNKIKLLSYDANNISEFEYVVASFLDCKMGDLWNTLNVLPVTIETYYDRDEFIKELAEAGGKVEGAPEFKSKEALEEENKKYENVVFLKSYNSSKKLDLIKALKDILGIGLTEAKALVESVPVDLNSSKLAGPYSETGSADTRRKILIEKITEAGGVAEEKIQRETFEEVKKEKVRVYGFDPNKKISLLNTLVKFTEDSLSSLKNELEILPGNFESPCNKDEFINALKAAGARLEALPGEDDISVIKLLSYNVSNKSSVICKVVKFLNIRVTEAQELVESAPVELKGIYNKAQFIKQLKENGCEVEDISEDKSVTAVSTVSSGDDENIVILKSFDSAKKFELIKTLKNILGLGLAESKDLVEKAPVELDASKLAISAAGSGSADARKEILIEKITAAGGVAEEKVHTYRDPRCHKKVELEFE